MKLYHYTTFEALLGILKEQKKEDDKVPLKQKDQVYFWGTRYDSLNDPRDYIFARDIIIPEIKQIIKREGIPDTEIDDVEFYPYIVSFSELGDNLNMWRLYHSEVCIEIDGDRLLDECNKKGILFGKCEYVNEEKEEILKAISKIHNGLNIDDEKLLDRIRECSAFVKHRTYESEAEYRIIKSDFEGAIFHSEGPSLYTMRDQEIPQEVNVKCVNNKDIILYKEFTFNTDVVKGIIVCEQSDGKFQKIKKHLELVLFDRGYKDVLIEKTKTYYNE